MKTKWSWKAFGVAALAGWFTVIFFSLLLFNAGQVVVWAAATAACAGSFALHMKYGKGVQDYRSASGLLGCWTGAILAVVSFLSFVF